MPGYSGGTAAADISRFRGMVAESGTVTYTDDALRTIIARYPLPDAGGNWPYLTSGSVNTAWVGLWDLANAASEVWGSKAAAIADRFDFTADGATFHKSQQVAHYEEQARTWRSRRAPGSYTAVVYPAQSQDTAWIVNINDPYE